MVSTSDELKNKVGHEEPGTFAAGQNIITYYLDKNIIDRLSKADPKNVQEVAASQIQLLNKYYSLVLEQSHKSFR